MKNSVLRWGGCCLVLLLLTAGCVGREQQGSMGAGETGRPSETTRHTGKIDSLSRKAGTIFLIVGTGTGAQTVVVRFDDATIGVDELSQGHFVTVDCELRKGQTYAKNVQRVSSTLPEGIADIDTEALARLIKEQAPFLLVDPRPAERYQQSHLPGAVSIPATLAEKGQQALLPRDKETLLVFYDGGHGRGTAIAAATAAKNWGFSNIRVYTKGRAAWIEAERPTYTSREAIRTGNPLLIDTRNTQVSTAGRIRGAYQLPLDRFALALRELPRDAPIVLYGNDALDAMEWLSDAGFTTVTLLEGGYAGWLQADGAIDKGANAATPIRWERRLEDGEVSLTEFRQAVQNSKRDVLFIDVRAQDEISRQGMIANAVNIPLDALPEREATLPRDKTMYLYCATGARAKMAYKELAGAGFKAKFLRMNLKDLLVALQKG